MTSPENCTVEHLAEVFGQYQQEIIGEWRLQAAKLLRALNLDNPTLTDHIPDLVGEITRNLARRSEGDVAVTHAPGSPPVHGVQRFYDGLNVDEVVAEYNLLRVAFITIAERHGLYVVSEAAQIINHGIDQAVRLAVMAFAARQELIRKQKEEEHLAFIAHDLRTPLNAVSLLVEELRLGLDSNARTDAGDLFEILHRNLQRMEELIKKVLDTNLPPPTAGFSFHPQLRKFELWPLVQRLIVDLRAVSSKNEIEVVNEISSTLTIYADAGLLSQVFQNLFGNAFKYAAHGKIIVSASADTGGVTCIVSDNGAGIPPEMLTKVFEKQASDPFNPSTGLGLTIVKQIVEAHGGTLGVESIHGKGAKFTFTIPTPEQT